MSPGRLLALAGAALALAAIGFELFTGWRDVRNWQESALARESLRRLAALTIRNFPERNLENPELFWKSIGREGDPIRDYWGQAYEVNWTGEGASRSYRWYSCGPDRRPGTADDIVVEVPYPAGILPEGAEPANPPTSFDAK